MTSSHHDPTLEYYEKLGQTRFVSPKTPDVHSIYKPSTGPIFSSPYGPFPEPIPADLSIHDFCFPRDNPLPPHDYDALISSATDERVSLFQLYGRIKAFARAIAPDGPNPLHLGAPATGDGPGQDGEILGICSRNHLDWPMLAHACFRAGVPFGGVSPASTVAEMRHVLGRMRCTGLIVHEELLGKVRRAVELARREAGGFWLDEGKIVVLSEDRGRMEVGGWPTVEALVRVGLGVDEGVARGFEGRRVVGGERLAFLFQSSGTSGLPKAMMITHRNAIAIAQQSIIDGRAIGEFIGGDPIHHKILGIVPCYHSYGAIVYIARINLFRYANVMLLPRWNTKHALETIERYRITSLPMVPQVVRQLAQYPDLHKHDLSSVIAVGSGAAYLPPDVAKALGDKLPQKQPVGSGYGMSEAASISRPVTCGIFGLPSSADKLNTVGYLLPGMSGRIVDPTTMKDVPTRNTPGEMWVRGENVTPGYFHDAQATAELFAEPGWLRTGDLCSRDEADQITYVDRFKELIKVKGFQVAPSEVEDCLLDHPDGLVRDACVVGVIGEDGITVLPRAWVVLGAKARGRTADEVFETLTKWVQERLSRYKWLDGGIEQVESIPRTESGKMLRREMRDRYEKGQGRKSKL
ncbi:4-coumarate-CoA ligase [Pseudovirgaria hyperparasitica]|uniref:4-coumarate-CoA ligase n=1 Tax=Pseudovirgaria hyperparasitica TaxID=470096 RepID=A0A6A6WL25_9PEZI|nr:4-coumarate-CoA ligase [Pseudovirgaria hyperparasitica]KAF2762904.1 4-coumarate-CoA ligase [Pseudovirgaria hyperparasitica]